MSDKNSYDEVPYKSHPFPQSHPDRLAAIAHLFGVNVANPDSCRVLELGCASGGNLIPMAEQFPNSRFVGIDLSGFQIDEGKRSIEKLKLDNIELMHLDILDVPSSLGQFDYVICHGVFSWVPPAVQDKILEICQQHLNKGGVGYISYNTFPGWHMRGMIRDIMRYRAKWFESPTQRLAQARSLLTFLTNSVKGQDNPFSMLLQNELEIVSAADDSYLHHEHLEDANQPMYFYQFVELLGKHQLQYVGDAEFGSMALGNFPENVRMMIQGVSKDEVELEQLMDFLRNRGFRQSLICHQEVKIDRQNMRKRLNGLRISSSAQPEAPIDSIRTQDKVVFKRRNSNLQTNDPVVKAAFVHLRRVFPNSVPFAELVSIAKSIAFGSPVAVDKDVMNASSLEFAETLLRCYETSMVDLSLSPPAFTVKVSERPCASPMVQMMARSSSSLTNRRHENVTVDDLQRNVLLASDGTRTHAEIAEFLVAKVLSGELVIYHDENRIVDRDIAQRELEKVVAPILENLAGLSLLIS